MSEQALWVVILGGMAATYAPRASFIVFVPPQRMPAWFRRGLRFVAPAVLAGLVATELVGTGEALNLPLGYPRLMAGALAALVAWRSRNTWLTILAGMAALWLMGVVIG